MVIIMMQSDMKISNKQLSAKYNISNLSKKLDKLKKIKSEEVDINSIKDISELRIDQHQTSSERILSFLNQGFNPYLYRIGDSLVEICYSNSGLEADKCIMDIFKDIYK